jgi:phosphoserine phosphatase
MPMKNKDGRIVGVFQLLNKRTGAFTPADEVLIEGLSVHAALALENARLYEQERLKMQMERDLHAAREVQMSLIPKKLPEIPGYEFAATTIPAKEVGGDLYDFHRISDTTLAISLGDVSGKGLPAALVMANMLPLLRSHAVHLGSVKETIHITNRDLHQYIASDRFVTLFFGVLDTNSHTLTFSNAGQEPPYLVSNGSSLQRLDAGGIPVGMLEEFPYVEDKVQLTVGDMVVMNSDGVSEAMNADGKQFGEDRLARIVLANRGTSASVCLQHIITAVQEYVGATPQSDDITVVVIRRLPG